LAHQINPNLRFLCDNLKHERRTELIKLQEKKVISFEQYKDICIAESIPSGVLLEGSSRSGKTTASVDFNIWLTSKKETNATINIIRETYNSFKTTLWDDFNRRLNDFSIRSPFDQKQEVASFKLFGNKINFLGADSDKKFLGAGCDYVFFNEMLEIPKEVVDQAIMRCRKFWWGDFNPKYSDHFVFNSIIPQKDIAHIRTTYRQNPFISPNERIKIESYQPVEFSKIAIFLGSQAEDHDQNKQAEKRSKAIQQALRYDCEKNPDKYPHEDVVELKRCQDNERTGTADAYKWAVFGLGERRAPDGLIFPKVTWVQNFPSNCEKIYWGLDFGYTESPSVLVKVGVIGTDIFLDIKFYQPTASSNVLIPLLRQHITDEDTVWADPSGDSGGRGMITECRRAGLRVFAANTFPGSIKFGIGVLKKYNIHLIDCKPWREEQSGYTKDKARVNGTYVSTDDPIDAKNHAWDASRLAAIMNRL